MAGAKNLGATGVLYTDRRDFYLSPNVVKELWTDVTPFTTFVANQEVKSGLKDPIFKLFEHRNPWIEQKAVVNAVGGAIASDDSGNTVTFTSVTGLDSTTSDALIGLEVEFWNSTLTTKKGVGLITANSSGTYTVKNMGLTSFTPVTGDIAYVIGNAQPEGHTSPEAWADELKVVWGSTQIFKTPIEITGTLYQAALRGETDELARLRLQKNQEHKIQKEKAFMFGSSVNGTGLRESYDAPGTETFGDAGRTLSSKKVRSTMGVVNAIEKYGLTSGDDQTVFSIAEASYKYSNFVDDMEKVFRYYPEAGEKYAFCGPGAMSYWSKLDGTMFMAGKSGWQVKISGEQKDALGFNIRKLETPHGVLNLVNTPAFRGPYNKYMLVPSASNLFHAIYRPSMFQANIKTDNAYDGVKDQYFSDEGVGMTLLEAHKLFKIV